MTFLQTTATEAQKQQLKGEILLWEFIITAIIFTAVYFIAKNFIKRKDKNKLENKNYFTGKSE